MLGELYAGGERAGREQRALAGARARRDGRPRATPSRPASPAESSNAWRSRARWWASPTLLLCDEPTGNLDSANTEALLRLFDALASQGLTLVVVTHDDEVAAHANAVVRMVDGRLSEVTG